ncbi:MAG: alpha/beta hydrolase [Ruminiclostridium sp.]|nr:alpha/beta hydrolase [Ruminiclostridium sp.]
MGTDLKNGTVPVGNTSMSYVSFGSGEKKVILIPGLSDGLATVRGKAALLAKPYRPFFKKYTVYMFSRKDEMPEGYSIRDMAADQAAAMKTLGIGKACIAGVSQGGMISQYIAADNPGMVDKLVLAVTAPYANETIARVVADWIGMAERGDHKRLMLDTAEKSYSDEYLRKKRAFLPLLGFVGRQKSYRRFLINAHAILGFDARAVLKNISCPTLIIGGGKDKTVGAAAAGELHELITGSRLHIYPELGHAAYEEAGDFNRRIFDFFGEDGAGQ